MSAIDAALTLEAEATVELARLEDAARMARESVAAARLARSQLATLATEDGARRDREVRAAMAPGAWSAIVELLEAERAILDMSDDLRIRLDNLETLRARSSDLRARAGVDAVRVGTLMRPAIVALSFASARRRGNWRRDYDAALSSSGNYALQNSVVDMSTLSE